MGLLRLVYFIGVVSGADLSIEVTNTGMLSFGYT